mmetsp:Transcript_34195/g.82909  ORF Transcript_34195/g.82909 Transcript_34195/m.82909 type:complete len:231 (-) Transcript_34195:323-1015(-)
MMFQSNLICFVNFIGHGTLPFWAYRSVEIQGCQSIFIGAVWLALYLNFLVQLFTDQFFEFARPQDTIVKSNLHEWFKLGGISCKPPRMGNVQCLEVVLQGMSYQDVVLQELQDHVSALFQGECGIFQILRGDSRNKGTIIGHWLVLLDVLIKQSIAIPIDDRDSGNGRGMAVLSNADHFTVQCEKLGLFRKCLLTLSSLARALSAFSAAAATAFVVSIVSIVLVRMLVAF